jgi:hypothetical protein
MSITYSECVLVALVTQHATLMRHVVICGLSAIFFFPTLSHKRHDFRKKSYWTQKRVFWNYLQLLFETFLILRWNERDVVKNVHWFSCKVPFILVQLKWKLNFFFDRFLKNTRISNVMKIRPVGAELFHTDRRTDWQRDRHDEANSRFSQLCERA